MLELRPGLVEVSLYSRKCARYPSDRIDRGTVFALFLSIVNGAVDISSTARRRNAWHKPSPFTLSLPMARVPLPVFGGQQRSFETPVSTLLLTQCGQISVVSSQIGQ